MVSGWYANPYPAFGLDQRTVSDWHQKAGRQAKQLQEQLVCQGHSALGRVQGDQLYVKTQFGTLWMATAMSLFSRLFVWGAIAPSRDTALSSEVVQHVRAAAQKGRPLLWAIDGFGAWTKAVKQVLRDPQPTGKHGRPPLLVWAELQLVQVVKQYRRGPSGSGNVLDGRGLQLLPRAGNPPGHASDGSCSGRSCLDD